MENDLNFNEISISIVENKFELEYFGQNLNKNESFIQWQNEMKKIYGNDAKLFKCKRDKIFYYARFSDCKVLPLYKIKCPICNLSNCYFCSKHIDDYADHGKCCLSRRIYCLFFQDAFQFIERDYDTFFVDYLKIFLSPLYSLIFFVVSVSACLFYKLKVSNLEPNDGYLINYEEQIKDKNSFLFILMVVIIVMFAIFLSISFFICDIYLKSFLCIISIFLKNYPIKYYFCMLEHMGY